MILIVSGSQPTAPLLIEKSSSARDLYYSSLVSDWQVKTNVNYYPNFQTCILPNSPTELHKYQFSRISKTQTHHN